MLIAIAIDPQHQFWSKSRSENHEWFGYYWVTSSRVYCGMNYIGSSCEDIHNNHPETGDKSGHYRVNDNQ